MSDGASADVVPAAATTKPMGAIKFVAGTDPHEIAFTISIPERWKAVGGAYGLWATCASAWS
jgi:hypothetical protein